MQEEGKAEGVTVAAARTHVLCATCAPNAKAGPAGCCQSKMLLWSSDMVAVAVGGRHIRKENEPN